MTAGSHEPPVVVAVQAWRQIKQNPPQGVNGHCASGRYWPLRDS